MIEWPSAENILSTHDKVGMIFKFNKMAIVYVYYY